MHAIGFLTALAYLCVFRSVHTVSPRPMESNVPQVSRRLRKSVPSSPFSLASSLHPGLPLTFSEKTKVGQCSKKTRERERRKKVEVQGCTKEKEEGSSGGWRETVDGLRSNSLCSRKSPQKVVHSLRERRTERPFLSQAEGLDTSRGSSVAEIEREERKDTFRAFRVYVGNPACIGTMHVR